MSKERPGFSVISGKRVYTLPPKPANDDRISLMHLKPGWNGPFAKKV